MVKRKVAFDARKNSKRKKYAEKLELTVSIPLESLQTPPRQLPEPSLIVSLPISAYKSASIGDVAQLQSRLKECTLLPPGWITNNRTAFTLYKIPVFAASAGIAYTMEINDDMSWLVRFGDSSIRPDIDVLRDCSLTITSINQLLCLLNKIDEAILCIGNADSQFDDLVSRHKGNFKDSSGKYNLNA